MITIRGTDKIKGMLDLGGINKQLKAGDALPIADDEFMEHTVQVAVRMGFITYKQGGMIDLPTDTAVNVKNIYDRAIRINCLNNEVRSGQIFTLTEEQINSSDIRGALAKGLLKIVSSARPASSDESESNVKVGDLFKEELEEITDPEGVLETNEEVTDPGVIESDDPEPVKKQDIPDPKGKTVIWNPNKDPIAHTRTGMDAIAADNSGPIAESETNVEIGDISFVDENLDEERRKAHPILKNKPTEETDGLDFL